jgi:2-haloacid dehalogenase
MEHGPVEVGAAAVRPHVVAFDVVETLMSLEPLRPRIVEIGLPASTLERWFALVLRDGMALTLARDYEPFPAVAASALRVVGAGELTEHDVEHVIAGLASCRLSPTPSPRCRS